MYSVLIIAATGKIMHINELLVHLKVSPQSYLIANNRVKCCMQLLTSVSVSLLSLKFNELEK